MHYLTIVIFPILTWSVKTSETEKECDLCYILHCLKITYEQ